ncbi:2,3-bisphosphoglycerate-dependent phosphoglycerate mutase [Candidatus Woesearchaeota archaeon]|nr:2,3-bisphosphoglycerate-dependent phosphoglycerate mutase [Candidatus Woesearchaeota archaeon]
MKIYIFRHGQTYYNRDKRFTGWKDSKLTPLGIKQSKKIANRLKKKKIDVAYQTRLSRSKDTLKYVLKYHPECKKTITDNRMIERNYGKLQGTSHKEFVKEEGTDTYKTLLHWHKVDHLHGREKQEFIKNVGEAELKIVRRSYSVRPPRGESVKDVEKRVKSFIKDLLKKMGKEKINVAISAHGNSMRPFRKYFEKLSIKEMMELENPWDNYFEYTVS